MKHTEIIWQDRKRNMFGLPWTFTKYILSEDRLFIDTGILNQREDDVRLYRITDLTLTRSLWQRLIGTGTIHCDSADQTMKNFDIRNVKNAFEVKETLSDLVEKCRLKSRVIMGESVNQHHSDLAGGILHDGMLPDDGIDAQDLPCDDLDSH